MRTLSIHGIEDIRVHESARPHPSPGSVRIRVAYVGICGSDLHYYFHGANGQFTIREPLSPGHELSGTVDLDPRGRLVAGTPVTVHPARFGEAQPGLEGAPHLWSGGSYLGSASTWPHTQGAMSDYLVVDERMIRVLPPSLPLRRAALAEPLAVAIHGISRAGGVEDAKVLVCGAGPIGVLAAFAARALGAHDVTICDIFEEPLERAQALGIDRTVHLGEEKVRGDAYDVVLECSGVAASVSAAVVAVRPRGVVAQIGMLPDADAGMRLAPLVSKEARLVGSFRFHEEITDALSLLNDFPEAESIVTHVFDAADAGAAFSTARDSRSSGKVLVSFQGV